MDKHWMVQDETSVYYDVTLKGKTYSCSCSSWDYDNHKPCKHINAVSGAKVSVRQRKVGEIIRLR